MNHPRFPFRVGLGFDFHPFEEGSPLFLGGVRIPHSSGLKGYSDADVLLHAVADALLGAAGLPDIGVHFPDSNPVYKGISSSIILEKVYQLIHQKGFVVGNVDIVVIAELPKVAPFVEAIRANLAHLLKLDPTEVAVKATTMEGKGTIGRAEGIAVQAVALIQRIEPLQGDTG